MYLKQIISVRFFDMNNSNHSNILIIGGGCAGISVATRLKSLKSDLSISIIEPSEKSLYQ